MNDSCFYFLHSMDDRPQRIADYFVVVGLGGSVATRFEPYIPYILYYLGVNNVRKTINEARKRNGLPDTKVY